MPRRLFTRYLWPSVRAANSRNRVISIPPVRLRIRPSPPSNTLSDAYDPFVINRLCAKLAFHAHGLQKAWLLDRGCVVRFSRNFYLLLVDRVKLFHYQQFSPPPFCLSLVSESLDNFYYSITNCRVESKREVFFDYVDVCIVDIRVHV